MLQGWNELDLIVRRRRHAPHSVRGAWRRRATRQENRDCWPRTVLPPLTIPVAPGGAQRL